LRVLREVGLVDVRREGRQMLYRTNAEAIRPLYEWTQTFERMWKHQLARIKEQAEAKKR
jgi:DNA-binding transcriptional ArsR family regulator